MKGVVGQGSGSGEWEVVVGIRRTENRSPNANDPTYMQQYAPDLQIRSQQKQQSSRTTNMQRPLYEIKYASVAVVVRGAFKSIVYQ